MIPTEPIIVISVAVGCLIWIFKEYVHCCKIEKEMRFHQDKLEEIMNLELDHMRFSDEFLSKIVESNYSEDITYTALKIKKNFHNIGDREKLELNLLKMLIEYHIVNKPPKPEPSVATVRG